MLPDRVSNPGPLTYESGALPIAIRGPAYPEKTYPWISQYILDWLRYKKNPGTITANDKQKTICCLWKKYLENIRTPKPATQTIWNIVGWMICDFMSFSTVFQTYIWGRWADDNERLCANGTPFMVEKNLPQAGLKLGTARSVGQHLTHWATRASPLIYPLCSCLNICCALRKKPQSSTLNINGYNSNLTWVYAVCLCQTIFWKRHWCSNLTLKVPNKIAADDILIFTFIFRRK